MEEARQFPYRLKSVRVSLPKRMKPQENIILNSLKESFELIRNKRFHFAVLFLTQFAFLAAVFATLVFAGIEFSKGMEASNEFLSSFQGLTEEASPEDIINIMEQSEAIDKAYSNITAATNKLLFVYLPILFLLYILLNGINWDIANTIVHEHSAFLKFEAMFSISTIFFAALALILGTILFSIGTDVAMIVALIIFVLLVYFAYISFGLIFKYKLSQTKEFLKAVFYIGFKKAGALLFSYFFAVLVAVLAGMLVYNMMFSSMTSLFLSIALLVIALAWGKIYLMASVKKAAEGIR